MQKKRSTDDSFGLDRKFVTSQEIYDQEADCIFSQNWICVARLEELDSNSRILPIEFDNHRLFIVADENNEIRTFRNFCRHRGSRLITPGNCSTTGQRIQCPYHAWTYDRTGRLVSAPNMDGADHFNAAEYELIEVPSSVYGGFIWINFSPQQKLNEFLQPLTSYFSDWGLEKLRISAEIKYEVRANWKLIFQNYSECYHCPIVHPALNQLTPYKDASNDLESGPILGGPMQLAEGTRTMSRHGNLVGQVLPGLNQTQAGGVYYFTIFPTMFFSPHPDYVLIHRIERIDVGRSRVVCQLLFDPDVASQASFDARPAVEFWDETNRQDWNVCELSQAGMEDAGFVPGPYSNLESIAAAFDRHYKFEMGL